MPAKAITDIHAPQIYHSVILPMWVLYKNPTDFPEKYVLRLWDGATNTPRSTVFLADTEQEIEFEIKRFNRFVRLERFENDDPKIMAVFV